MGVGWSSLGRLTRASGGSDVDLVVGAGAWLGGLVVTVPTLLFPPLPVLATFWSRAILSWSLGHLLPHCSHWDIVGSATTNTSWLVLGYGFTTRKQRIQMTFDSKASSREELPEHQIHIFVGNPRTPSLGKGVAGPLTMGWSYRHSL